MKTERHAHRPRWPEFGTLLALTLSAWGSTIAAKESAAAADPRTVTASEASGRPESATASERMTGTVKAVDDRSRIMILITGVGHSLRVVRVAVPQRLTVHGTTRDSTLSRVTPGCVVRVDCARTPSGRVARTVTVVRLPQGGSQP